MRKSRWLYFLFLLILLLVLISCGQKDVTEDINQYLEEAIEKEAEFEAEGEQIYEYEMEEDALYNEMLELEVDEHEEIKALTAEALKFVKKRKTSIEEEKSIMDDSKKSFEKVDSKVEKVTDDEINKKIKEMVEVMEQRYRAYDEVYERYQTSIDLTKELYDDFGDKSVHPDQLYNQVDKVNDSYEKVTDANEVFNDKTTEFNEIKTSYLSLLETNE